MPIPQPVSLSDQALADIIMELESIKDEEQDKYDNLQDTPFAESDRANDMESAIEQLDEAIDCLQSEPPDYVGAAESLRVI